MQGMNNRARADYRVILGSVLLVTFGILMLMAPDVLVGAEAAGRRTGLKELLIAVWGVPGGTVCLFAGGVLAYVSFSHARGKAGDKLAHKVAPPKAERVRRRE